MHDRTERVASLLLQEISQVIREEIQEPGIGFVTLLRAEVSKDLQTARIHYSVMGSAEEQKQTDLAIKHVAKRIKGLVNDRIQLRYAIDLRFIREDTIEESFKIQKLFDQIQKERDNEDKTEES